MRTGAAGGLKVPSSLAARPRVDTGPPPRPPPPRRPLPDVIFQMTLHASPFFLLCLSPRKQRSPGLGCFAPFAFRSAHPADLRGSLSVSTFTKSTQISGNSSFRRQGFDHGRALTCRPHGVRSAQPRLPRLPACQPPTGASRAPIPAVNPKRCLHHEGAPCSF